MKMFVKDIFVFMFCDISYIYALVDPNTGQVRYVGQSIHPNQRYKEHLQDSRKSYKVNWLSKLKRIGLTPKLEILQCSSVDNVTEQENFWIDFYNQQNKLTNSANGNGTLATQARRKIHLKNNGTIGLSWDKKRCVWLCNYKHQFIGNFKSKIAAAKHYDNVARFYELEPITHFPGTVNYSIEKAREISSKVYRKINYGSYFSGIVWNGKRKRFRVSLDLNNGEKMVYVSAFKDHGTALMYRDSAAKYYNVPTFKFHDVVPKSIEEIRFENKNITFYTKQQYSKYRGVSFSNQTSLYTSNLLLKDKIQYIGSFNTDKEAALWHDRVASYYGLPNNNLQDFSVSIREAKRLIKRDRQKSEYIGVRVSKGGTYTAKINLNKKECHIGSFEKIEEAVYYIDCVRNFYNLPHNGTTEDSMSLEEAKLEIAKSKPPKGIRLRGNKYFVEITINKKRHRVGNIKTLEQAFIFPTLCGIIMGCQAL
jgi:hypothetical protein